MLEKVGDMWRVGAEYEAVCITTNGFVKKNGEAVMGRGCAAEAAEFWPGLPSLLGLDIRVNGNVVQVVKEVRLPVGRCATFSKRVHLVSFPVKPGFILPLNKAGTFDPPDQATVDASVVAHMRGQFKPDQQIPGWACIAQPTLICDSAHQLVKLADSKGWKSILLPRPGCGAGELQWFDVSQILRPILDDRFSVISRKL